MTVLRLSGSEGCDKAASVFVDLGRERLDPTTLHLEKSQNVSN